MQTGRGQTGRGMTVLAAAAMTNRVVAAMAATGPVLAPIACPLFLVAVAWPVQRALQARIPSGLAVILAVLATSGAVGVLGAMVGLGGSAASPAG